MRARPLSIGFLQTLHLLREERASSMQKGASCSGAGSASVMASLARGGARAGRLRHGGQGVARLALQALLLARDGRLQRLDQRLALLVQPVAVALAQVATRGRVLGEERLAAHALGPALEARALVEQRLDQEG